MRERAGGERNRLDYRLWQACAGRLVQVPPVNSAAFYFPQGHAEHSHANGVHFSAAVAGIGVPAIIPCRVAAVDLMASSETDEVFAKIRLVPLMRNEEVDLDDDGGAAIGGGGGGLEGNPEKPTYFAKTLTQSDANNGGGFSVPRHCAETIFPPLDYEADPPVQTVVARDVHGQEWKFRHIYRGTPRRHLLTTGWSTFVNNKKLVAGDSIVFLKTDSGEIYVGIRRAKRGGGGGGGGHDSGSGWNYGNCVSSFGRFSHEEKKLARNGYGGGGGGGGNMRGMGKIRPEAVIEAVTLAARGQPFEVVYYPSASTAAFCVKASAVKAAMRIQWCSGTRFKMAFETEDSSRVSWFMGTVASVQVADQIHWPNSPWRLLEVTWDEPDLLQNVKCINPWLVELANMPVIQFSSFSPRKKLRLHQQSDFTLEGGQFPVPSILGNTLGPSSPLCYPPDNTPAGIQGARHVLFGVSISDLPLNSNLQSGTFPSNVQHLNQHSGIIPNGVMTGQTHSSESLSCLLTTESSGQNLEKSETPKKQQFVLFGQHIVIEQKSCSSPPAASPPSDAVSQVLSGKDTGDGNTDTEKSPPNDSGPTLQASGYDLNIDHCNVFLDSEDLGVTLDLSDLRSYEEFYRLLAKMFAIERSQMLNSVLYHDATGVPKRIEDEPFSDFMKTAKRLTIVTDSGSKNTRTMILPLTGPRSQG
ncbi:Auxin response factor [Parasponia andersonii]|uniref:Auxin response factor n=1 Tax=Parasponia andersonii TaxID=3476 RepID=A0A2P5DU23_PARAD|nr:Auxin response factor [Parasponia andersonii]